MPAIQSDAALLNEYSDAIEGDDNELANAFLTESDDALHEPSEEVEVKKKKTETPNDDNANEPDEDAEEPSEEEAEGEDGEGQDDEQDEENDEDEGSKKKFADDDDETYVKVKEGDEEHEVKVSDLKRLWGQEKALTRKSQEVAAIRQQHEQGVQQNVAAYNVLLTKASERAQSYRDLPWTQLMKDPDFPADQLAELQKQATAALEEESFLKNEIGGFMEKVRTDQLNERRKAAGECLKALNDPKGAHHIKGWNDALYNDIRSFATEQGINAEMVNNITDPGAIKVLHMAMQFARGAKKVVTKKVNKTPTKIVKNSASAPAARSSSKVVTVKQAVAKAAKTGSMDDAMNAFLAMEGE